MFDIYKIGKELEAKHKIWLKAAKAAFNLIWFSRHKNDIHISATNQKSHDLGIYSILCRYRKNMAKHKNSIENSK